jgi:hypothetical protein
MDLLEVKNRIAEALVESIFRRARYDVTPFARETIGLRVGREDFSPDVRVIRRPANEAPQEFLVEVKCRAVIEQYPSVESQRGEKSIFVMARQRWPNLHFVFVSERPAAGRSCFQVVKVRSLEAGVPVIAVNLDEEKTFGLFPHNVGITMRRIFALLQA